MVFDLLKVARGENASVHYVVTCDSEVLGRISDAAEAMACRSESFIKVRDGVDLSRAVAEVMRRGKEELQS